MRPAIIAMTATPPTTPPAMAPTLLLEAGAGVGPALVVVGFEPLPAVVIGGVAPFLAVVVGGVDVVVTAGKLGKLGSE